jgi:menaquinone-dependent protoporphyrinogen IX oxidase
MKIVIVYESMFGNTRQIAEAIADGARDTALVSVVNVNDITPPVLENANIVIVGAPTHAHSLSRPATRAEAAKEASDPAKALALEPKAEGRGVREWLESGPSLPGLFAAFDTRADVARVLSGAASSKIDRMLHGLGSKRLDKAESFLVNDNRLDAGERDRAQRWGAQLAKAAEKLANASTAV